MSCRLALASFFAVAVLAGGTAPAESADMGKTLRVAFSVAETGFDPQVTSDVYSSAIIGAIIDPLYVYDYFARPVRMVPNTAAALPEVTDEGRTYTIKVKPGIYFASDPAFKGKRRELTAEDYVYSIKRIFDPKVRSYWVYVFEGNLLGLDDALRAARKSGVLDYDAKIEGLQALDRYTLRIKFQAAELRFRVVAHDRVFCRRGARSRRRVQGQLQPGHGESGGHRPVPAEGLDTRAAHRARSQSRLPRRHVSGARPGQHARRRGDRQRTRRPQAAAGRQHRHQHHRGGAAATAFVRIGQARLSGAPAVARLQCPRRRRAQARSSRSAASPSSANSRRRFRCSSSISTNPVVGGYTPEKLALRRAISMGYDRATAIAQLRNGQAIPANQPVPPPLYGHDPKYAAPYGVRPARRARAARQVRLQGPRRRRLPRTARRQAVDAGAGVDDGQRVAHPRRTVEAEHGCARHPDHVPQEQVAGTQPDVRSRPADDVGIRVDQQRPGGHRFLQLFLQQEHRHVERRAHAPARLRRALREVAQLCPTARRGRRSSTR